MLYNQHAQWLFKTEIYDVAQSLSSGSSDLYHGIKSSILQQVDSTEYKPPACVHKSAIISELSPFFRKEIIAKDFDEYDEKLAQELSQTSSGYGRVDIIAD